MRFLSGPHAGAKRLPTLRLALSMNDPDGASGGLHLDGQRQVVEQLGVAPLLCLRQAKQPRAPIGDMEPVVAAMLVGIDDHLLMIPPDRVEPGLA